MPKIYTDIEQGTPEWFELRKGTISGSRLSKVVVKRGNKRKIEFYEILAEKLGTPAEKDGLSSSRERGHEFEDEARQAFMEKTGKKVEQVGFIVSDDNPNFGLSPDGIIYEGEKITEAIEIKNLGSSRHLQAYFEQDLGEHQAQAFWYFSVLPDLKKLTMVYYDNRIRCLPYHTIELIREEHEEKIEWHREYAENTMKEVDELVKQLTF